MMIKVGLQGAPPFTSAGIRFLFAGVLIALILMHRRIQLPRSRSFAVLTVYLGLFQMAIPYALVYWAEQHLTAGLTAVLFSTMPLMVAVLARLFLGDPLSWSKLGGILIGAAGVYVIYSDSVTLGGPEQVIGVIAVLFSALFASASSVIVKKYSKSYQPFATIFLPHVYGGIILTFCGAIIERESPLGWSALTYSTVIYLAILGSVTAFALYFWLIKHLDVTVLSYQTLIIPVLACLLGWIFLRETVTLNIAIGGTLVLFGILLAVVPRSHQKRFVSARP